MKRQFSPFSNPLPVMAALCFFLSFTACQTDADSPSLSLSCPDMNMMARIQGNPYSMRLISNVIFRQTTDSGGIKFMGMETLSDSFKIVLNLRDGLYAENALKNDSLRLDTFCFSRTGSQKAGLVVAAITYNGVDFDYLATDTSSITILKVNTKKQTISGSFYFAAGNHTVSGEGTFENACYVSLQ